MAPVKRSRVKKPVGAAATPAKSFDIGRIRIDKKKEAQGLWFDTAFPDVRVKVRPLSCPDYLNLQAKLMRELPIEAREGIGFRFDVLETVQAQCVLDTILLDWQGLEEHGKPLKFSDSAAKRLLLDPSYRLFRAQVILAAQKAETAVLGVNEADEKN